MQMRWGAKSRVDVQRTFLTLTRIVMAESVDDGITILSNSAGFRKSLVIGDAFMTIDEHLPTGGPVLA